MKNYVVQIAAVLVFALSACNQSENKAEGSGGGLSGGGGQATVEDTTSQKDVVKIAVGSKDHTTLVTAVKTADLVNSLANAGPFTVFAPVNAAFDKLPKGTVEELLKPENKEKLADILQHHVAVAVYEVDALNDGQVLGMVDGNNATIHKKDGATFIDDAKILASVRASNGIVHVIDGVVLAKK